MNRLASFIGMGIFLVLLVVGIIVFSYIILIGAAIGLVLFAIAYVRARFFNRAKQTTPKENSPESGRVIEHDEIK